MADAIPFGQPILVGHHSEKRDRNYRNKIHRTFEKSFETQKKAERISERAAAAESNDAISSDDPEALVKLREKLAGLEERQAYMKKLNAAWRTAGKPHSEQLAAWHKVADIMGVDRLKMELLAKASAGVDHFSQHRDRAPAAPYELTNNNANIRSVKERIKELAREGTITDSTEVNHEGICKVVHNVELNRLQLVFPGKPDDEVRALLKGHGFRWARSERAWQRKLNNSSRYAAKYVVEQLLKTQGEPNAVPGERPRGDGE
jgi:hypothetical protein